MPKYISSQKSKYKRKRIFIFIYKIKILDFDNRKPSLLKAI